ncbi:MAG: helix-turn-helix transcriptional regulator [Eubacteriales bacterium]|nr:helix-turn-helix transcriptional regulator [Eubacteriales bacterium]
MKESTTEELKSVIARNLIALRTRAGMKQSELGERIHYSDKSISKWERGEGLPDVAVLVLLAQTFGVTLDYFVTRHDDAPPEPEEVKPAPVRRKMLFGAIFTAIWAVALTLFVIFWLQGRLLWYILMAAVPLSLITLLVLNSTMGRARYNFYIISALALCPLPIIYLLFLEHDWWQLFLLAIPIELVVIFSFFIRKRR